MIENKLMNYKCLHMRSFALSANFSGGEVGDAEVENSCYDWKSAMTLVVCVGILREDVVNLLADQIDYLHIPSVKHLWERFWNAQRLKRF